MQVLSSNSTVTEESLTVYVMLRNPSVSLILEVGKSLLTAELRQMHENSH